MESLNQKGADLVIVSAFGRGNWLATELADRGWQVTLVDVSEKLGPWEPEDAEGPFGFLETADLVASQKTRLESDGDLVRVPSGFTIWLKNGPLDGKGELTALHLEKKEISANVVSYLRHPGLPDKQSDKERRELLKKPFRETWLAHLAHAIASPVLSENHLAMESGAALPLLSPFSIRQASKEGWFEGLKACEKSGVKVRTKSSVLDVRIAGKTVDAIEVEDDRAGVEQGRSFAWLLSSQETRCMSESVYGALFPDGWIEPEWFWARYRVEFRGRIFMDQIPLHSLVLEDPFLPWTHENAMIMRKPRGDAKVVDLWVKLPIWTRSEPEYLKEMQSKIEAILAERIPLSDPKTVSLPAEARNSLVKLGPPRHSVYRREQLAKLTHLKVQNFFFCGPEQYSFLDWLGQFRAQSELMLRLEKLRAAWLAQDAREAARSPTP